MRFDLTDIKAFVTVAKLGSFTAAAAEMHISQPALSRRIEKLEAALNTRLLKRTTRKVDLTQVGTEFNRRATELLYNFDEALLGIGDAAKNISGEVPSPACHRPAVSCCRACCANITSDFPA